MRQILIIHGGSTFANHDEYLESLRSTTLEYDRLLYSSSWKTWLAQQLHDDDVLLPTMPNSACAQYEEWKIYFDKIVPFLTKETVVIGHSLGGIFLSKYLGEHSELFFKKIILVAAPYNDETAESLSNFSINSAAHLHERTDELHFFHSTDDPVVPYAEVKKYLRDNPQAQIHTFSDKHHFISEMFDELKQLIEE